MNMKKKNTKKCLFEIDLKKNNIYYYHFHQTTTCFSGSSSIQIIRVIIGVVNMFFNIFKLIKIRIFYLAFIRAFILIKSKYLKFIYIYI